MVEISSQVSEDPLSSEHYIGHVYQEPGTGWCGPTVLHMIFAEAGIDKSPEEIANTIMSDGLPFFIPKWGCSKPHIEEMLAMHFDDYGVETQASFERIAGLSENGYQVILNVMSEDLEDDGSVDIGGHLKAVKMCKRETHDMLIHDPSNGVRPDGKKGVYWEKFDEKFKGLFWDYATPADEKNGIKTQGLIAWVNPLSAKVATGNLL